MGTVEFDEDLKDDLQRGASRDDRGFITKLVMRCGVRTEKQANIVLVAVIILCVGIAVLRLVSVFTLKKHAANFKIETPPSGLKDSYHE